MYVQTLSNEDSRLGHLSCAFVFLSLSLFTDAASTAHTINTAWPQKIERMEGTKQEEGKERKRDEEETKRRGKASVVKKKGGGGWGTEEEMGEWGRGA